MPTDKQPCTCRVCAEHRRVQAIKRGEAVKPMQNLIDELEDQRDQAEEDLEYHRLILSGEWPQAVEILERALERARVTHAAD